MRGGKVFTRHDYDRLKRIIDDKDTVADLDEKTVDTLKHDLEHSQLVEPTDVRPNIVTMNSKICLKNIGNGRKQIYSLVFPGESATESALNVFSCIGTQVLGSTIGTVIKTNPVEDQYVVIEEILYQPEAAGDYHL